MFCLWTRVIFHLINLDTIEMPLTFRATNHPEIEISLDFKLEQVEISFTCDEVLYTTELINADTFFPLQSKKQIASLVKNYSSQLSFITSVISWQVDLLDCRIAIPFVEREVSLETQVEHLGRRVKHLEDQLNTAPPLVETRTVLMRNANSQSTLTVQFSHKEDEASLRW